MCRIKYKEVLTGLCGYVMEFSSHKKTSKIDENSSKMIKNESKMSQN